MDTTKIVEFLSNMLRDTPNIRLIGNLFFITLEVIYLFGNRPVFFFFRGYQALNAFFQFFFFWAVHNSIMAYMYPWYSVPTVDVLCRFVAYYLGYFYSVRDEIHVGNINPPNNTGFLVGVETNPGPVFSKEASDHPPSSYKVGYVPQSGWMPQLSMDNITIESIGNLSSSLLEAAESLRNVNVTVSAPELSRLGEDICGAATILKDVNIHSTSAENIFQKITSLCPDNEACHKILIILATIVLTYTAHGNKNQLLSMLKIVISGYVGYTYPLDYKLQLCVLGIFTSSAVYDHYDNQEEVSGETPSCNRGYEPQIGGDAVSAIASSIIGFIWYQSFSSEISAKNIAKFLKSVGDLPKLSNGINFLIEGLISMIQKFVTYCTESLGMDDIRIKDSLFPELDALGSEFSKFITELRQGAPYNYDNAMRLFELEQKVNNMVNKIPNSKDYVEYKKSALSLAASIKPLVTRMERNNIVGNGPRREPLGIMLGGPTGVGKSTSIVPLILAVNALVMPEEKLDGFQKNHNDYIWNFIPENPFFDSYHGQFNTIIDEAGAQLDAAGSPDPGALGVLRMINGANFPLHMANLEDKGNTNFNSELIFATTNRTFFNWNSMYCPEAYCRRFKCSYLVVPKLKYCKDPNPTNSDIWLRRLDLSKIPETASGFCPDVNEFHPYDFRKPTAGPCGSPLSFDEVILKIASTYKAHKLHADSLLSFHSDIKSKYIEMRRSKMQPQSGGDEVEFDEFAHEFTSFFPYPDDIVGSVYANFKGKISRSLSCMKEFGQDCKTMLLNRLEPISESWSPLLKSRLMNASKFFLGLAVAMPSIALLWKFLGPALFTDQSGYPVKHRNVNVRPGKAKSSKELRRVYKTTHHEQAGVNQNCLDVCNKLVNNNLYTLDVILERGPERMGFALFTHGRCAMFPEHFTHCVEAYIRDGDCCANPLLRFKRVGAMGTGFDVLWDDVSITYVEGVQDDINYMVLPEVVPSQKDVRAYFASADELKVKSKFEGALLRPIDQGFALITATVFPVGSTAYGSFSLDKGFQYDIATKRGECGAPLFLVGQKNKPLIVGMHVAGNGRNGIATTVARERIDTAFETVPFIKVEMDLAPQSGAYIGENFLVCEEVDKLRVPFKNQVVKSRLHEAWGPSLEAPALLRVRTIDGVTVDPWRNARSKYSCHGSAVNTYLLEAVSNETISEMIHNSTDEDPWPHRVLGYEEAVSGVDTIDFLDGIPRNTSAGYPFCNEAIGRGKTDWFGHDGPYDFSSAKSKKLKALVFESISRMEKLEKVDTLFADYLKDERRPKEKVAIGKTRLISACSVDSLIIFKMYFGDLIRWLMQNRVRNSMAVGVNPYSHEWDYIARWLTSVGDKCIFGDYRGYDGSLYPAFMYKFLDLADAFYSGSTVEQRNVRYSAFENIVNSRHVCSGDSSKSFVYEWFGSNPSGNLLTTLLNSFCNVLIIKYAIVSCWGISNGIHHLRMKPQEVNIAVAKLGDNTKITVFGDDGGLCISDDFSKFVDQQKITKAMLDIGFVYTDEAKEDVSEHTFRKIEDCSFLKRGFVLNFENKYTAPLELSVILEMCYWTKSNAPAGSLESTIDTALMELSLHGKEIFNKYSGKMVDASIRLVQYRPNPDYRYNLSKAMHHEGWI